MTVTFGDTCSSVVGPPQEQKEGIFLLMIRPLLQMILDSIQHTLQYNFCRPAAGRPFHPGHLLQHGRQGHHPAGWYHQKPSTSPYQGIMISDNREG